MSVIMFFSIVAAMGLAFVAGAFAFAFYLCNAGRR